MKRLLIADRLVTCDPTRSALGVIEGGAMLIDEGQIETVDEANAFDGVVAERVHAPVITPGLVDAHTHAVWAGSRATEYAMRMKGADYEEIAAAGGGIVSSMRAVRAASAEDLATALRRRVQRMAALGVTTVEVKSGYGLSEEAERKQLTAVVLTQSEEVPALVPTFLGMHAVPPGTGSRNAHAKACAAWLEGIAEDGLARYVDAYVDRSAFNVAQAEPMLLRAKELGLGVRVHVGQFADVGGAEMAAKIGAATVDHLENVSRVGADRLAAAGVRAVMLPVASFTLDQPPPKVAMLRRAGVELVVASDANPGTAPTESLPLAMAMAVRTYGMTVEEVVLGVTRCAAESLGSAAGVLAPGRPADVTLWDLAHEDELIQPWGRVPCAGGAARRSLVARSPGAGRKRAGQLSTSWPGSRRPGCGRPGRTRLRHHDVTASIESVVAALFACGGHELQIQVIVGGCIRGACAAAQCGERRVTALHRSPCHDVQRRISNRHP